MFTGIIETTAKVLEKTSRGLTIERPKSFADLKIGSSVSVAGVCLSVIKLTKTSMQFEVVPETLKKSRLGTLKKGERVNLERAMRAGERLDGHVVQGHVEGKATVTNFGLRITKSRNPQSAIRNSTLVLRVDHNLMRFIVQKGSIAIDGVSLTVADVDGETVTIALIPHTLKHTTLGSLKKGDRVNVETDILIRSSVRAFSRNT